MGIPALSVRLEEVLELPHAHVVDASNEQPGPVGELLLAEDFLEVELLCGDSTGPVTVTLIGCWMTERHVCEIQGTYQGKRV